MLLKVLAATNDQLNSVDWETNLVVVDMGELNLIDLIKGEPDFFNFLVIGALKQFLGKNYLSFV